MLTHQELYFICSTHGHMGNQVQVKGGDIVKTGTITSGTWNADTISIAKGGTGATTAAAARTALGLDSTVTNNSTDVTLGTVSNNYLTLSGQEITAGTVPISLGGTGATTAAAARTALGVDVAGTDNSTAVTLTNTDYLSISGQAITAGTVPISKGGTGLTSIGTAGQVLKVNSGASGLEWGTGGGSASEAFKTIAVAGQSDVVADSSTDTLTFEAGSNMTITTTPGSDKITFASSGGGSASDAFKTIAVAGQSDVVADSSTDTLTFEAGSNMTITTTPGSDKITFASSGGGGGGASEAFKTIAVSGQSDVVADSATDTLTLVAGSNMTITTNATGDSITFASSGGGGGGGGGGDDEAGPGNGIAILDSKTITTNTQNIDLDAGTNHTNYEYFAIVCIDIVGTTSGYIVWQFS